MQERIAAPVRSARTPSPAAMFPEAAGQIRRRRISPQAGRALEVLGHAIDYLADQHIFRYSPFPPPPDDVEAWELLKALNREIYLACPVVPTLRERFLSWVRGR